MPIALGADHAGFACKEAVKDYLLDLGYHIIDHGTHTEDSVDYPDFVHPVATDLEKGKATIGFLFCGSANGVAIAANKHAHIRAAIAWLPELAELARQHNNANVLCLPARYISHTEATACVHAFLEAQFEGGRHQRRVDKINPSR